MQNSGDLTILELKHEADHFCQKHWGCKYTGQIELVNCEWKNTLACFRFRDDDPSFQVIRMSRKTNSKLARHEVLDNLYHELVHWRLYTTGQPFNDDDAEFVAECIKVGSEISGTKIARQAAKKLAEKWLGQKIYFCAEATIQPQHKSSRNVLQEQLTLF